METNHPSAHAAPSGTTSPSRLDRRQFLAGTGAAFSLALAAPQWAHGAGANDKITIGLIGCGGRGSWIAGLFQRDGRFQVGAVCDYFADKAEAAAKKFELDASKCFSGVNGYRKLLGQKLDAVVIESPPFFHPVQAADAVDAGKHVFLAKPVAVDVPGCNIVANAAKKATHRKQVFMVDFQTRAHPAYQEVVKRCRDGQIGKIVQVEATYHCGPTFEKIRDAIKGRENDPEARLRAWGVDRILSGDVITEQNIHCLDVATWFLDAAPVKAYGVCGQARDFGTCSDHFAAIYQFPDNVIVSFNSKQLGHGYDDILCRVFGTQGTIDTHYAGAVTMKSKEDGFTGNTPGLYQDGAVRNIAAFYEAITKGDFSNATVPPSVRSNLTTILGRTACYERREVTWDEMMKANERFDFDVKKLKQ